MESTKQVSNAFDQQGQTVHGDQWNLAVGIHFNGLPQQAWPSTIRPLRTATIADTHRPRLQNEFYDGGYTRFEHILAGVDFRRNEKLAEIAHAFEKSSVSPGEKKS